MPGSHQALYWLRIQATEPSSVEEGVVWLDTSTTPATVKRRLTSSWESVAGGPGGSGDLTYVHTQGAPTTSWAVNHFLGKFPSITIVDGTGNEIEGDVTHDDDDHITLTFATAVSGVAYAN